MNWGYAVSFLLGAVLVAWPAVGLGRMYQESRHRDFLARTAGNVRAMGLRIGETFEVLYRLAPGHFTEDDRRQVAHLVETMTSWGPK